jgi:hypothetical protein
MTDGLSASDWRQIRAQVDGQKQAARYRPVARGDTFIAGNPVHGFDIRFRVDGSTELTVSTAKSARRHQIELRPQRIGYAGSAARTLAPRPLERSVKEDLVITRWDETLSEWWVNSSSGLQQWFELVAPPAGRGDGSGPLVLSLTLASSLAATLQGSGVHRHVQFEGPDTTVRFEKLQVFDADGRRLRAIMRLDDRELAYVIDDAEARYPLIIDPTFVQQGYMKASNTDANDGFGSSVAVSGSTVVIGAPFEDSNAIGVNGDQDDDSSSDAGAAYVFVRDGNGSWSQQAYLKASNTDSFDGFGFSVAVSGDTIVVGANREDSDATGVNGNQADNSAAFAGAAYVFMRDGGGNWSQQAYLKASNTDADQFGSSVAVSGDTVVVGAPLEASIATGVDGDQTDNSATAAGAAYVFVRDGGNWSQQAYLKASNTDALDAFGGKVAVSADTAVIAARFEDSIATGVDGDQTDNSATAAGAAYVFVRDSGGAWTQDAYLKASNSEVEDYFGTSVAVSGDTAVVGASGEDGNGTGVDADQADNSATDAGAAYVFVRDGAGAWSQQAYLKASNTNSEDFFGASVANSGDIVLVGAPSEDGNAIGAGGDQADNSAGTAGAAYAFRGDGTGGWSQKAYLKASNTDAGDVFASSVAVSVDTLVVGARAEDGNATGVDGDQADNSATDAGAAYILVQQMGNAELDLMPDSIDFGNIPTGDASSTKTLSFSNPGVGSLQVTSVAPAEGPFVRVGGSCGAEPFSVPAGGSCTIDYQFQPVDPGSFSQVVAVESDAIAGSDTEFTLLGTSGQFDVAVLKTNAAEFVLSGVATVYDIQLLNLGLSDLFGVEVVDILPPELDVAAATWTCTPGTGVTCPVGSGSGDIDELVDLPAGAGMTFTLTAPVLAPEGVDVVNTVTATLPPGVEDENPSNNSATDSDPVAVFAADFEFPGCSADLIESRFCVVGENVVLDTVTGLEWRRCSEGRTWDEPTQTCVGDPAGFDWAAASSLAPPGGWRLPTVEELSTLRYCSDGGPALFLPSVSGPGIRCTNPGSIVQPVIEPNAFPDMPLNAPAGPPWFWTSTDGDDAIDDSSLAVSFGEGNILNVTVGSSLRVLLVR